MICINIGFVSFTIYSKYIETILIVDVSILLLIEGASKAFLSVAFLVGTYEYMQEYYITVVFKFFLDF